ncbi:hypothetical protein IX324_001126 [Bacteroides pyogenes]|nr:hypothetical protein [Bacteroides pyogenes]
MSGRGFFRRFDTRLDRWDKIISTMTTKIANILQWFRHNANLSLRRFLLSMPPDLADGA